MASFRFVHFKWSQNKLTVCDILLGHALIDLLQRSVEDPPVVGARVLCRHPFQESKRAYVIPTRVEPLYKVRLSYFVFFKWFFLFTILFTWKNDLYEFSKILIIKMKPSWWIRCRHPCVVSHLLIHHFKNISLF